MRNSKAIRKPNNFWQSTGRLIGYTKRWMRGLF